MAEGTAKVRQFTVSTRHSGHRRTVRVKVYDDLTKMRADAERHSGTQGQFENALGVTHSFEMVRVDADGTERSGPAAALVRLWRGRLGTSVVVHEMVHAASGIYRQDWEPEHGPVHEDMDNEEVLSYLIGDLTRRAVDRLYALGFYAPETTVA